MTFTPEGPAPPGIPLLGCSPPTAVRCRLVFGGILVYFRHKADTLKLVYAILLVIIFNRPNLFCCNIYSLCLFVFEMPYHKKRKTDRPPRELIPEDSMKAAGAAILDGKPVNAVATASGVTHMTLEQYIRKLELLQTPYVD